MIIKSEGPDETDCKEAEDILDNSDVVQFKIVYWGPGESGKTTNFMRLRERYRTTSLTRGYSIETTDGRTLWQDSFFIEFKFTFAEVNYTAITQVVTCTGQERFLSTREYILENADGVIFVGDSASDKLEQNKRSFRELIGFAAPKKIPFMIQLNKRDLEDAIDISLFKKQLGLPLEDKYNDGTSVVYPSNALTGDNVLPIFQDLMGQAIFNFFKDKYIFED